MTIRKYCIVEYDAELNTDSVIYSSDDLQQVGIVLDVLRRAGGAGTRFTYTITQKG